MNTHHIAIDQIPGKSKSHLHSISYPSNLTSLKIHSGADLTMKTKESKYFALTSLLMYLDRQENFRSARHPLNLSVFSYWKVCFSLKYLLPLI